MGKNTSFSLGEHFEEFISEQIKSGRFSNRSEVVRSALRAMEDREKHAAALREALQQGEDSGPHSPLVMEDIISSARKKAGLDA